MIGAFRAHDTVLRNDLESLLGIFLQNGLVVLFMPVLLNLYDLLVEEPLNKSLRTSISGVQIICTNDRLNTVTDQCLSLPATRFFLSPSDEYIVLYVDLFPNLVQGFLTHHI